MTRRRPFNPTVLGPAGVCDACGAYCYVLIEAGIPCYKCHRGTFIHRRFWVFTHCPFCAVAPDPYCSTCNGFGAIATPREDLDLDELERERAEYAERERQYHAPRGTLSR
jgi:hypothetical protein